MNTKSLIHIDNCFAPFNSLALMLKKHVPVEDQTKSRTLCIKFFGLGSIVRILHVIQSSGLNKEDFIFLTLDKNQVILDEFGFRSLTVRTNNPINSLIDALKLMQLVWKMKSTRVIDFERSSNLASLFSHGLSVGKPLTQFTVKEENTQRIPLQNVRTIDAIAQALRVPGYLPFHTKKMSQSNRVLVNVNSGDYMAERRYPINRFAELINELAQRFDHWNFVFSGMPSEAKYVEQIRPLLNAKVKFEILAGKQTLSEFITCIQEVQMVITNDSSPLHLANYLGTPCVAIWGPTGSAQVGYPNSDRMLNVSSNWTCSPCFLHPKSAVAKTCEGRLDCFTGIETQSIVEEISEFALKLNEEQVLYEPKN